MFKIIFPMILFFILAGLSRAPSYERAKRISDREIITRLTRLEEGQKSMNNRFDDMNNSMNRRFDDVNRRFDDMNRRFDDVMSFLQILTVAILAMAGGIIGWLVVIWKKLVRVETKQDQFETQDDEIKFLKTAYNKLNDMVVKLMDVLKPPSRAL